MQKFEYRAPRFPVDLAVDFVVADITLSGRCTEISQEGMRLELLEPLPTNAYGTVLLNYLGRSLELNVRVAHAGATHDGLEFVYESDRERTAVAHLVASLAAAPPKRGPILIT